MKIQKIYRISIFFCAFRSSGPEHDELYVRTQNNDRLGEAKRIVYATRREFPTTTYKLTQNNAKNWIAKITQ